MCFCRGHHKGLQGKDLAEMYDMHSSGAAAFSDGMHPVQSAGLLLKALQYIKTFDGVIIQVPDDKSVGANGLMNEGIVSTRLGLPGKPMMAEELIIARISNWLGMQDQKFISLVLHLHALLNILSVLKMQVLGSVVR